MNSPSLLLTLHEYIQPSLDFIPLFIQPSLDYPWIHPAFCWLSMNSSNLLLTLSMNSSNFFSTIHEFIQPSFDYPRIHPAFSWLYPCIHPASSQLSMNASNLLLTVSTNASNLLLNVYSIGTHDLSAKNVLLIHSVRKPIFLMPRCLSWICIYPTYPKSSAHPLLCPIFPCLCWTWNYRTY